jgi:hypothetical protein
MLFAQDFYNAICTRFNYIPFLYNAHTFLVFFFAQDFSHLLAKLWIMLSIDAMPDLAINNSTTRLLGSTKLPVAITPSV